MVYVSYTNNTWTAKNKEIPQNKTDYWTWIYHTHLVIEQLCMAYLQKMFGN